MVIEKTEKLSGNLIFIIYSIIFTIGPSFTKIFGQPISRIATLIAFPLIIFLNIKKFRYVRKDVFFVIITSFYLKLIPFIVNGESERIIVELIDVYLPLVFILFVFLHNHGLIERMITVFIITSAILCVFGFVEEFTQFNVFSLIENYEFVNPRLGTSSTYRWGIYRIEQGFNTALTYELYLAMCIGLTFYRFLSTNNSSVNYMFVLFMQISNCILTMSRGITFVLAFGIAGILFSNRKVIKLKYVGVAIIILAALVYCLFQFQTLFLEGFSNIFHSIISIVTEGTGGAFDDNSILDRNYYQRKAFEALQDSNILLFGVGVKGIRDMSTIDNDWLLELSGFGIFGFLSFAILSFYPLVYAIQKWKYLIKKPLSKDNLKQLIFYKCMTMTFLVYILSLFTVAQMEEARMFYFLFGINCCYFRKNNNYQEELFKTIPRKKSVNFLES